MRRRLRSFVIPTAVLMLYAGYTFLYAGWYAFIEIARFVVPFVVVLVAFDILMGLIYLVVSWCVCFRFLTFAFGPIRVIREWNGIRIRRNRGPFSNVETVTRDPQNLSRRLGVLCLTYPIVGLLLGLTACLIGFSRFRAFDFETAFPLAMPLFAALGILRASFGQSDARTGYNARGRIAMLRAGMAEGDRYCALILLGGARYEGQRPRDWSAAIIERISFPADGSLDEVDALIDVYYHALDRGDLSWAGRALTRLLVIAEESPTAYRETIFAEAAFYQAFVHQDSESARGYVAQIQWGRGRERVRARVEAAILLAEGKREEAWARAMQGTALPDHVAQYGFYCAERDWFSAIMARAMGASSPSAMLQAAPA